jgi:hypothetical protein
MVNNQNKFNNEYNNKKLKNIEFRREEFQGQLVIEDYSELEHLNLRDIDSIDKVVLKNLLKLKECIIWDCNVQSLVIENCPQLKKLIIYKNLLTSLEFIKDLESLEELEVNGNAKLTEILNSYKDKGGWEACQKDIQELNKLIKENPRILSESREKYADLKTFLKEVWKSLSKGMQDELMGKLDNEIKSQEQMVSDNTVNKELNTTEIKLGVRKSLTVMKEIKEELNKLKEKNEELREIVIKKEELEKLKNKFLDKSIGRFDSDRKKEKIRNNLEIYLASIGRKDNLANLTGKQAREYLLKGEKKDSELTKLLNKLNEEQWEISLLEQSQPMKEMQVTFKETITESKSEKAFDLQFKKGELKFGIPTPWGTMGISGKIDRSRLTMSEQYLQQHKEIATEIGQNLIKQLLEIQKAEDQSQQVQIEHLPKGNN